MTGMLTHLRRLKDSCWDALSSRLDSFDQTTRDLFAALHPHRSWQNQVRAHRGKCALTPTTHHVQATGETCAGYLTHPFKNQQGPSWVEHLARDQGKVEMISNWSSPAYVSGTERPCSHYRGLLRQPLLTGCDASLVDLHAEPKGSTPQSSGKTCWHLG